jgi:hypothetical protein
MRLVDGLEGDTRVRTKKSKPRLMDVERSRDVPSACHTPLARSQLNLFPNIRLLILLHSSYHIQNLFDRLQQLFSVYTVSLEFPISSAKRFDCSVVRRYERVRLHGI